jgi:ribonucleoside-diphosphate reductase alpha chain
VDVGKNRGETLRNACTEVTSADDSDICNLGSINMGKIDTLEEFKEVVKIGTLFLIAGTLYSHVPYAKVAEVRSKNRRLGLGLMGMHEWLLKRGKSYGSDDELEKWLKAYAQSTKIAHKWADELNISAPVKTRAIAPTGTIAIIGETTTGIEPVFCAAYKRRWSTKDGWKSEYVIDPTVDRLVSAGLDPHDVEDAYSLANTGVERRVEFQAWVQQYVDHGISSTINLPHPVTNADAQRDFGDMLMKYLPNLRGITVYPNGARAGQPITAVPFDRAARKVHRVEESEERCVGGACGI